MGDLKRHSDAPCELSRAGQLHYPATLLRSVRKSVGYRGLVTLGKRSLMPTEDETAAG